VTLAPGTRLGPYEILSLIGSGGMGEVYRARDTRLDRIVAVKILLAADSEVNTRFDREAKAIAALSHPHICAVYDVGQQDGTDYLVMEYLEGQTLAECLTQAGPLAVEQTIDIGRDVATALEYAHCRGLVHRDLKPANIMLTPNGVKLLDFGLAKAVPHGSESSVADTKSASVIGDRIVGTVRYMAPEQLLGQPVDRRTDVFALGVVLYEMLTGHPPFAGSTVPLIAAILHQPAAAIGDARPGVPATVVRVIERCLEKDANQRWATAESVANALAVVTRSSAGRRVAPRPFVASVRPRKRIIRALTVLPFRNVSSAEHDYAALGITEAVARALGAVHGLRLVSARPPVESTYTNLPDPAALDVEAFVEGTIAVHADRVQVAARVVHAPTRETVWDATYERSLGDLLDIEQEVAESVAAELELRLRSSGVRRRAKPKVDPRAQEAYLRARFHWSNRDRKSLAASLRYYEEALAIDPAHALVHVGIAEWYVAATFDRRLTVDDALAKAQESAAEALRLDPTLANAHECLGAILIARCDWSGARRELEQALHINANLPEAHVRMARLLAYLGDVSHALEHITTAQKLDPMSPWVQLNVAAAFYMARQFERAIREAERAVALTPDAANGLYLIGLSWHFLGDSARAITFLERSHDSEPDHVSPLVGLAYVYAQSAQINKAHAIAADLNTRAQRGDVSPYDLAELYVGLGESQTALDYLDRSWEQRVPYIAGIRCDALFDPIRGEPRFRELLVKMNLVSTRSG
jgi:tetratricopeptide (TPR) repeat protein